MPTTLPVLIWVTPLSLPNTLSEARPVRARLVRLMAYTPAKLLTVDCNWNSRRPCGCAVSIHTRHCWRVNYRIKCAMRQKNVDAD
jgi:hypothetical protein